MLACNPYRVEAPALISFSGGRTSGYMLSHVLDAYDGTLPDGIVCAFANVGKERSETLDFVQECSERWGVHIYWLEWVPGEHGQRFTQVSHNSASRNGEPYKALIRQKQYLPNPVTSFCTIELKIRVMRDFARQVLGWDHWKNVVGLRYDEQSRVIEALARVNERWTNILPLNSAKVTKAMVKDFWREQPFDLRLNDWEGNCDLCFKKGMWKIIRIMRDRPDLAKWWIEAEAEGVASKPDGARFRIDRPSYADLLQFSKDQGVLPFDWPDDDVLESCEVTCSD